MTTSEPKLPSAPLAAPRPLGHWVSGAPTTGGQIVQRILGFPRMVFEHRDLILTSVRRDLEARFKGTLLGFFWPLIHPLFLFVVYYFIFTKLLAQKLPEDVVKGRETTLAVYMFLGVAMWSGFADTLLRGTSVIVDNGNLIKKLAFPAEALALNVALVNALTFTIALLGFLIACCTPLWHLPSLGGLAWLPVLLLLQVLFSYGLALMLATLHVFLRDTAQIAGIFVTVWMFLTPIFWVPYLPGIRESIAPYLVWIDGNPMSHLLYAWRYVLMGAEPVEIFPHDPVRSVGIFALWALGAFVVGYTVFLLGHRRFADEV
jgi:ABC-type polysaccharide/polyol phosphate export permease